MRAIIHIPVWRRLKDVDWLVNIDASGFDPSRSGAAIEYTVDIDNNGFDAADPPLMTVTFDIPAATELTCAV